MPGVNFVPRSGGGSREVVRSAFPSVLPTVLRDNPLLGRPGKRITYLDPSVSQAVIMDVPAVDEPKMPSRRAARRALKREGFQPVQGYPSPLQRYDGGSQTDHAVSKVAAATGSPGKEPEEHRPSNEVPDVDRTTETAAMGGMGRPPEPPDNGTHLIGAPDVPTTESQVPQVERKVKKNMFDGAIQLADTHPDEFAFLGQRSDEGYYKGTVTVSTTFDSDQGQFGLDMGMQVTREGNVLTNNLYIRDVQGNGNIIYRLEITYGDAALRAYQRAQKFMAAFPEVDMSDTFDVAEDGTVISYMSEYHETKISDAEASQLLRTAKGLKIPDHSRSLPTLEEFRVQARARQSQRADERGLPPADHHVSDPLYPQLPGPDEQPK